ncbi:TPA: hypothetical protein DD690_03640 [Candidatus Daviesbacteria bacterium]|nr:hypothetical protein [Candidatus Daviesbacteria bacterium]HCB23158.1 hypothetical protein [Candidatus Daviesbacteria bacterium]
MLNTYSSTPTQKGQVTIPASMRKKFGIKPGKKVIFEDINGQLVIKTHSQLVNELAGSLKTNIKWDKNKAFKAVGEMLAQNYLKTLPKKLRPSI